MYLSRVLNPPKTGLNLEKLNKILSETNYVFEPRLKIKPRLKFFRFGLRAFKGLGFRLESDTIKGESFKIAFTANSFHKVFRK